MAALKIGEMDFPPQEFHFQACTPLSAELEKEVAAAEVAIAITQEKVGVIASLALNRSGPTSCLWW